MKKKLSLLLALLMLSGSMMYSCGESTSETAKDTGEAAEKQPAQENTAETKTETETEPETEAETEPDLYADLKKCDYEGYNFRAMTAYSNFGFTLMDAPEITGEIINDTIYERNRAVEKELNIVITDEQLPDPYDPQKRLRQMTASGDDQADAVFSELSLVSNLVTNNYFHDLYSIEGIDWEKPWWEKKVQDQLKLYGKLYYIYTPMHLHYYESLLPLVFNKAFAEQYQLENLYDTVRGGKWTLDKMNEIMASVTHDISGDGVMNAKDDHFGIAASINLVSYYAVSAGNHFIEVDGDEISYSVLDERMINTAEKLSAIYPDGTKCIGLSTPGLLDHYGFNVTQPWIEGHALFYLDTLGRVKDFRELEQDFGVLPMPKYDEAQETYISTTFNGASTLIVPTTAKEAGNIGTILEYLGAYSYRDLRPAYYEYNVKGKQFRDQDSVEMLEIMLDNITVDLGFIYNWGIGDAFNKVVLEGEGIVSTFEARETAILKAMNRLLDAMKNQ